MMKISKIMNHTFIQIVSSNVDLLTLKISNPEVNETSIKSFYIQTPIIEDTNQNHREK